MTPSDLREQARMTPGELSASFRANALRCSRLSHKEIDGLWAIVEVLIAEREEKLAAVLREAIVWDGRDDEGEPAVWLEKAKSALQLYGDPS